MKRPALCSLRLPPHASSAGTGRDILEQKSPQIAHNVHLQIVEIIDKTKVEVHPTHTTISVAKIIPEKLATYKASHSVTNKEYNICQILHISVENNFSIVGVILSNLW